MLSFSLLISAALFAGVWSLDQRKADEDEEKITFFLHTKDNPEEPQMLRINDSDSVNASYFDVTRPTMVLVHGFMESSNFTQIVDFREAYVTHYNHNVIVVNYVMYKPSDGDIYLFYQNVGFVICDLLRFLIEEFSLLPSDVHVIGHSVGVHVSGAAGKCLKNDYKLRRISGLDPANWQDLGQSPMDVLRPGDAEIVDCIHTSTTFGIHQPICKCNYYPNGGAKQPECRDANEIGQLIGLCDHLSAFRYYQRTFQQPHLYPGHKCGALSGNELLNCTNTLSGYLGIEQENYCDTGLYYVPIVAPIPPSP